MSRARSGSGDNLLLMAATTILVLTAQHFFQAGTQRPVPSARIDRATLTRPRRDAQELDARAGPRTSIASALPWAAWKDILWRIYERSNDDRLLATAAGVVFFGLLALFPGRDGAGLVLRPVRRSLGPSAPTCKRWR